MEENIIYGRHPVLEALKADVPIDKIIIKKGIQQDFLRKIKKEAAQAKIPFSSADDVALDRISGGKNHQGIIAWLSARRYDTIEDILKIAKEKGEDPFILVLFEVQDHQNLGSLIRTADGAGVHGVVISRHRSARLSPVVSKVSAGADSYIKIASVTNIADTLDQLKNHGLFIVGADSDAEKSLFNFDFKGPLALVMGGEDRGLGQRVKNTCDDIVKIPLKGQVTSLNVGVAGGILMYKILEKR
jgi:23S rRNA (guanosine2251-2'-O)-methyltransferase